MYYILINFRIGNIEQSDLFESFLYILILNYTYLKLVVLNGDA